MSSFVAWTVAGGGTSSSADQTSGAAATGAGPAPKMSLPACSRSLAAKAAVSGRRTAGASKFPPPNEICDWPPGGAWSLVVGLSVMKLPQFWSAPLANALEELERAAEGAPNTWDCTAEGELVALSWAVATVDLTRSSGAAPKQMLLWPPGGAWRRVVGRSVMTLPQFWSEPLAKALDDCETGVGMRGAVSASRDC